MASVGSVIDKVRAVLQDTTSVRWPDSELIEWVNDAQHEIALIKPDATAINESIPLAGGTKQSLPANALRLLRVIRNMQDATVGIGGRAIRIVDREILDAQDPNWHDPFSTGLSAFDTVVKHYMYDEQDPLHFYVYPGIDGQIRPVPMIEIIYSAKPADVVSRASQLSVPDLYVNAVMNYVLYMAYMKDAEYSGNSQRAASHYQIFAASVTGKGTVDAMTTPNVDVRANPMTATGG